MRDDRASGDDTPPAVWFAYSPDRKGEHPQAHLANFNGVLQADAYAGFNAVYDTGRVIEAACWAHARRKFYDLHAARPTALTTEALRRIGELYAIEEFIRGKPPDERRAARQQQAKPPSMTWNAGCTSPRYAVAQVRYGSGDPVRPQAKAGADPLCRRWPHRDRQLGR